MSIAIPFIYFSLLVIGVFSGLSSSITVPIFMLLLLSQCWSRIRLDIGLIRLELIFFFYLITTAAFAINSRYAFQSSFKLVLTFIFAAIILQNINKLEGKIEQYSIWLLVFLLAAIGIIFFEIYTGGLISITFRELFQPKKPASFMLHNLDRGCSIMALLSWVVIANLLKDGQRFVGLIIYIATLLTLSCTDSLSSYIAFALSGGVYFLCRYFAFFRSPIIVGSGLVVSVIMMISFSFSMDAKKLADSADFLPLSAKHRLFIWEYTAEKSKERPLLGVGIGNSRNIEVADEETFDYEGVSMSPLPLHPHNAALQILLETGIIGLVLAVMIGFKYVIFLGRDYYFHDKGHMRQAACSYALFTTIFVISMISYNFWQSWWQLTIVAAIILNRIHSSG